MYSVCYVLTDGEKLEYYSEMVISICSLRRKNYRGEILVLLDRETKAVIDRSNRDEFAQFGVKPVIVDVPAEYSQRIRSRYIKTSIRKWVTGDYLFIDTDTVIAEGLPEVISEYEIAQAPDVNCRHSEMSHKVRDYHARLLERCGYGEWEDDLLYFNSGVMWVKDTELTHKIYESWHQKWLEYMSGRGVVEDQPALNQTNREMGGVIHRLPDVYNVQVSGNPFPTQYLAEAKIIHYIHNEKNSTYILSNKQTDKSDLQAPLIQQIMDAPRRAFQPGTMLRKDDVREILLTTWQFEIMRHMYENHPRLFAMEEGIVLSILRVRGQLQKYVRKIRRRLR